MKKSIRKAARRIIDQHFHEDEFSPLLQPEEDDGIRDDCLATAEAYLALTKNYTVMRKALERLENAVDTFRADQSRATDPRCGLTQPVTVAECEELNAAATEARAALALDAEASHE